MTIRKDSSYYSGKQIRLVKICKIFDYVTILYVTVKRIDEKLTSENLFKGFRKNKRSQRKTKFFCPN